MFGEEEPLNILGIAKPDITSLAQLQAVASPGVTVTFSRDGGATWHYCKLENATLRHFDTGEIGLAAALGQPAHKAVYQLVALTKEDFERGMVVRVVVAEGGTTSGIPQF